MKPTVLRTVRWVQPVQVGSVAEAITRSSASVTLTAQDFGVVVVSGKTRVLVPWANVKQADE